MAKLTLQELENLSRLLLSEADDSVELGLAILRNHPEAISTLQRELVLLWQLPDTPKTRIQIKHMLKKKFDQKQLQSWEKGFEIFRQIPRIYTYTPKVQRILKNHENIRADYQSMIERNSKYALKYYAVARRLHQGYKKHLDLAHIYFRIALNSNPLHSDILFSFAYLLDKTPEGYNEALKLYQKLLTIKPTSSAALNNVGLIYDNTGFPELAHEHYSKALQINPNSALYMRNLASLCTNRMEGQQYKDQAKELLQKLVKIDPQTGNNWNSWADFLWNIEANYKAAEEAYRQGLQVDPKNPWLIGNLGELYIDIYQKYDEGLELYVQSLEILESPYRLVTMIAVLVHHYKDYGEAKKHYKKLVELSPPNEIIRNRYLRDDQWDQFLEAEKILLDKIK